MLRYLEITLGCLHISGLESDRDIPYSEDGGQGVRGLKKMFFMAKNIEKYFSVIWKGLSSISVHLIV
jgi:hypothetical protein